MCKRPGTSVGQQELPLTSSATSVPCRSAVGNNKTAASGLQTLNSVALSLGASSSQREQRAIAAQAVASAAAGLSQSPLDGLSPMQRHILELPLHEIAAPSPPLMCGAGGALGSWRTLHLALRERGLAREDMGSSSLGNHGFGLRPRTRL